MESSTPPKHKLLDLFRRNSSEGSLPREEGRSPRSVRGRSVETTPRLVRESPRSRELSAESTPRSRTSSPRSGESTPTRAAKKESPRNVLQNVVLKIKKEHEIETPHQTFEPLGKITDEHGRPLGDHHYELFEYATTGNFNKVKEILELKDYTAADLEIISQMAADRGYYDIAEHLSLLDVPP